MNLALLGQALGVNYSNVIQVLVGRWARGRKARPVERECVLHFGLSGDQVVGCWALEPEEGRAEWANEYQVLARWLDTLVMSVASSTAVFERLVCLLPHLQAVGSGV